MYGTYAPKENQSINNVIILSLVISYDSWKPCGKSSFNLLVGLKYKLPLLLFSIAAIISQHIFLIFLLHVFVGGSCKHFVLVKVFSNCEPLHFFFNFRGEVKSISTQSIILYYEICNGELGPQVSIKLLHFLNKCMLFTFSASLVLKRYF